ncbi:MAG: 50S ribosomal protein L6, partial [Oscillospiraceae bacterium]|nr:50S ribosomal protein L6 [Oscillospiraceae bacterium]
MSRIGKAPIAIPAGVTVKVDENNHVTVTGPKGTLERNIVPQLGVEVDGAVVRVTRPNDDKENRSLLGLSRTLIANMVKGVTEGFSKTLEVNGVGYRAAKE